ncbi:hypothetical protein A7A08_03054 [Methyloligella halotolerans]|uniref:Uncharacterized protein n=2 Tax=Methyloligella halotolerans TaxID=1177755 RepID=A0A1E2RVA0_9HYPH|nr:hypothetical protein A7A08_03054 [Methyloligella halotolerans]
MYYPEVFEDPEHLLLTIDFMLREPSEEIVVPFGHFLSLLTKRQLDHFLNKNYAEPPKKSQAIWEAFSSKPGGSSFAGQIDSALDLFMTIGTFATKQVTHAVNHGKAANLMGAFTIRRPTVTFDTREQETLRGMARLLMLQELDLDDWRAFVARLAWGEGNFAYLEPDSSVRATQRSMTPTALPSCCCNRPCLLIRRSSPRPEGAS